jgi:hypothetical protein
MGPVAGKHHLQIYDIRANWGKHGEDFARWTILALLAQRTHRGGESKKDMRIYRTRQKFHYDFGGLYSSILSLDQAACVRPKRGKLLVVIDILLALSVHPE